ncbi:MAG: NUDIX hydrolase [Phycisphaerae bacterium]|jgi:ADP-ribose pyrophosphatase|nr:NUDIX hydrolase [Phycisphaerae bacterium]
MADEILLKSRKFKVVHRMIDAGTGEPEPKDLIIHPGAAVILPITSDNKVVMVRNYRWSINRELLELPAGTLEPLEEPQVCAYRELEEETGFTAGTLRPLCRYYTSPGLMTELMHAYVATDLVPGEQHLSSDEKIKVEIMSFDEIDHAIRVGRIMDGKTLATILYYRLLENK